jgi:hypothetical protein
MLTSATSISLHILFALEFGVLGNKIEVATHDATTLNWWIKQYTLGAFILAFGWFHICFKSSEGL